MIDQQNNPLDSITPELTYESTFEALQNPRRRWTLQYLTERDGPVSVGELADQITAWEHEISIPEITPEARKSVYNSLCQTHLPQLVTNGIVNYDQVAGTVELAPNAGQLSRYVPLAAESDDRWSAVFLGAATLGAIVVAVNWLGVLPTVSPQVLNAALVALFFVTSLVYAASIRGWLRF